MSRDVEQYPIVEILPEWVLEQEALGSKRKFWYRSNPQEPASWLFKYPQAGSGQHWAEKIAAEIAHVLEILHARVELAVFDGTHGSTTESFAREGRELYHGNQILAGYVHGYDALQEFRQSNHTFENIVFALDNAFATPDGRRWARQSIVDYFVLDALIGNTDRHHENWAILRKRTENGWSGFVAPTFDHASSLGRELMDDSSGKCRRRILQERRVGQYSEKARGAIFWASTDTHALSPLDLVRKGTQVQPELFRTSILRLEKLDRPALDRIVSRIPESWMSEIARTFAVTLISYNLEQLRKVVL